MTALTSLTSVTDRATPAAPVLCVTHGLHQGGRIRLDATRYTLGSALDADFILNDPGIAPRHLVLRLADGKLAVEALGGEVRVEDRQGRAVLVPAGSGYRGQLPLRIQLGEARLSIDLDAPVRAPTPVLPRWLAKPRLLLALGLMGICAMAFAFRAEPAKPQAVAAATAPSTPRPAPIAQARQWLEQQLLAAGFKGVTLTEVDGQLLAEGRHEQAQNARWVALRQAFDQRFGQQVLLRSTVSAQAETAKPRVHFQAVWFGDNPYVIGDGGKRLYPGAAVADGWVLERIDSEQVVLARGDERFTLTL
ncbi:FHA domain-containing protein [Pseudomonas entomophila]|uniref:SctD/MshK family protein n=1 Tax=Pseudomonas entomophila TaxID=312306 RepID=UPI0023D8729A|nr:FHA domain-containing protein [Pseudomonas entomophila]MDF0733057.1 FHA domain-containing protein [Pseudomonas entomophila]